MLVIRGYKESIRFGIFRNYQFYRAMKNKTGYSIYHDFSIDAELNKIFDAITLPDHLINWWPLKCTGEPKPGAEYNFNFTDDFDWYGIVSGFIPNQSFHIKMIQSDEDWKPTTFGFELEKSNEKVIVHFSHTGWPACNAHFKTASFCWALLLNGLKNYVEKGIIIPFEERS